MVRCGVAIYGLDPFQEDPAAHGLEPALALRLLGGGACGASSRATAPATGGAGAPSEPTWVATVPIGYGDGWRRGAHEQLRRADPRPPPPAGGHGEHGQHDRRPRARDRRGGRATTAVLIGAQGDERILAEEVARAARHDQLRGHLRPRAAGAPPARAGEPRSADRRARGRSRVDRRRRRVRDELLGRAVDGRRRRRGRATRRRPRAASRPSCGGPVFPLSEELRRLARARPRRGGASTTSRRSRARRSRRTSPSRDFTVNAMAAAAGGRRRLDRPARGAAPTSRRGTLRVLGPAAYEADPLRAAAPGAARRRARLRARRRDRAPHARGGARA